MRWYSWIICLGLLALMGQNAQAQFQNGDIIVGEFFDDFLRVNSGWRAAPRNIAAKLPPSPSTSTTGPAAARRDRLWVENLD